MMIPVPQLQVNENKVYENENAFIETYTGLCFYPYDVIPKFNITDIAHALSMCTRYNGHALKFYSVAEHSILVSDIMHHIAACQKRQCNPMEGLMHDATEAYLSDVPAPFKQYLHDWKRFDSQLEIKIRTWMGFPEKRPAEVKTADWIALFIEAKHLLPSGGSVFPDPENLRPRALKLCNTFPLNYWRPEDAELKFLIRFQQINHSNAMKALA